MKKIILAILVSLSSYSFDMNIMACNGSNLYSGNNNMVENVRFVVIAPNGNVHDPVISILNYWNQGEHFQLTHLPFSKDNQVSNKYNSNGNSPFGEIELNLFTDAKSLKFLDQKSAGGFDATLEGTLNWTDFTGITTYNVDCEVVSELL